MIRKMKTATKDDKRIKDVKVVGSIPKKTGLVLKSDLDIWIILEDKSFQEEDLEKMLNGQFLVEIIEIKSRKLMNLRINPGDEPIDVTLLSDTLLSELDVNRAVVCGGLLLQANMDSILMSLSSSKQKMIQDCVVGVKLLSS